MASTLFYICIVVIYRALLKLLLYTNIDAFSYSFSTQLLMLSPNTKKKLGSSNFYNGKSFCVSKLNVVSSYLCTLLFFKMVFWNDNTLYKYIQTTVFVLLKMLLKLCFLNNLYIYKYKLIYDI